MTTLTSRRPRPQNIVAMNTPGQNSNAVAELVFALMLTLARGAFSGKSGSELRGKKIGLQAYGAVGRCVTPIAKGFGMEVYAFDPYVPAEAIQKDGVTPVASVEELYKTCDYVSIHIPKTKETINSINFDLMMKMKKGAALINTARAEVIDEPSLLKMFAETPRFQVRRRRGAGLRRRDRGKIPRPLCLHGQEDGGADRGSQRQRRPGRRPPDRGLLRKGRQDVPGQQVSERRPACFGRIRVLPMKKNIAALTVAGSDSGGGAAIQADIKTFSACGVFATSVITAVTAQNLEGVRAIQAVKPEVVAAQLQAVLEGFPVKAVKTGMLFSHEIIEVTADVLHLYPRIPLVVDPVFAATSGSRLIKPRAIRVLCDRLFPMAALVTPNLPEAEYLCAGTLRSLDELGRAGEMLFKRFGVPSL